MLSPVRTIHKEESLLGVLVVSDYPLSFSFPTDPTKPKINNKLLTLFGFACFAVIGNLYYVQPLLLDIGAQFHKTEAQMGIIPTVTQIGYALGLVIILPLGDMFDRRKILMVVGSCVSIALFINGFSVSYEMLAGVSFVMGFFTIITQVVVPLSADLTDPKDQGKNIGFVMSGLLMGILLSRTISGWVGLWLGWRAVFWGASVVMAITTLLFYFILPPIPPTSKITLKELVLSQINLITTQRYLWQASMIGATVFGSFSCFWTTITFRLSDSPYGYNSGIIGLFSLIGAAGVIGSPIGGYLVDKRGARFTMGLALTAILIFLVLLTFLSQYLVALILCIFFYDVGIQTTQVCNQSRIYALVPGSKSRINSIYMFIVYWGGASGTSIGSWAVIDKLRYGKYGWSGSGATALILIVLSWVAYLSFPEKYCGMPEKEPKKENEETSDSSKEDLSSEVESDSDSEKDKKYENDTTMSAIVSN